MLTKMRKEKIIINKTKGNGAWGYFLRKFEIKYK